MSDRKSMPEPSMDEILASIRRILAEDEHMTPPPRRTRAAEVLDLTEALNDDGTVRHIAPVAVVTPEPEPPILSARHPPDERVEPAAPRPDVADEEPRLVSDAASSAVAASFARLAGLPRGDALEVRIDDTVREMLRPMLQAWLDENLPELVERLVKAEIARVVGAIRPAAP